MAIKGKTTRERMIQALEGIVAVQGRSGSEILKMRTGDSISPAQAFFQQSPLSTGFFNNFYKPETSRLGSAIDPSISSSDHFLKEYEAFEKEYFSALENQANHARGTAINVELMKKRGVIDLKLLNRQKADELYSMYSRRVLQLDRLIGEAGLPGVEMPSANLYSKSFRYLSETDQSGVVHPAHVVLNRSFFSFNARKAGMDSFTVSKNNLLSSRALRDILEQSKSIASGQGMFPGLKEGMRVMTLDVETTGVFEFSQVRSLSLAESTFEAGKLTAPKSVPNMNLLFDSPQLRGFTVGQMNGGSISLSNFLARAEGSGENALAMDTFLDESEKFIRQLLDADRIAGHNVHFDIDKITQTMMQMKGFESHTSKMGGAKEALRLLYEKIDEGNYLVDTLETTRTYLNQEVNNFIDLSKQMDVDDISERYVRNLFSEDILARVHIGGAAAPFSMENIALNTNLFELIEKDGKAEELFKLITKGSHVSETDVHLQTYVANYVQSGELKIWPNADGTRGQARTDFGQFARSKVLKSQAVTPTTNMADIQTVSNNVYQYLMSDEGARGVSVNLANAGDVFNIPELQGKSATLMRHEGSFGLLSRGGFASVDEDQAIQFIRQTLQEARSPSKLEQLRVGSVVKNINRQNLNINDLGISFGAASRADQIAKIGKMPISTTVDDNAIRAAFGSVYRNYGSGLTEKDALNSAFGIPSKESVFQIGLGDFADNIPGQIAQKFAAIGDPLYFMDAQSRSISTMMAESTAGTGKLANRAAITEVDTATEGLIDSKVKATRVANIAFSSSPKNMAELGVSYFKAQEDASVFRAVAREMGTSKIVAPTEMLKQAFKGFSEGDDTFESVGLSVFDINDKPRVNLVWNISGQMNKDQTRDMMKNLFEIMSDESSAAAAMGVDMTELNESIKAEIAFNRTIRGKGQASVDDAIELATETAMDRGIVLGYADEKVSKSIISSFVQMGLDMGNDVNLRNLRSRVLRTGLGKETIAIGPMMFEDGAKIAGVKDLVDEAYKVVDDGQGGKITSLVQNYNKIAQRLGEDKQLAREVGRNVRSGKVADEVRGLTNFYLKNKPKLGIGLAVSAIAGLGYYKAKKNREQNLYNEAVEKMPYQSAQPIDPLAELKEGYNFTPQRVNPLETAGVVGNLDRNKIGHYQMGTNKYDHLFGR